MPRTLEQSRAVMARNIDKLIAREVAKVSPYAVAVRADRRRAKLTLRELAKRVGVDFTYLSKIENAKYIPSAATAQRIAEEVGASTASHLRALGWHACPRCRYFHRNKEAV